MKEWTGKDIATIFGYALILVCWFGFLEVRTINWKREQSDRQIEYVKEQSERKIKYVEEQSDRQIKYVEEQSDRQIKKLEGRIEDYRKEYNQKWVEVYKVLIDLRKETKKEEK